MGAAKIHPRPNSDLKNLSLPESLIHREQLIPLEHLIHLENLIPLEHPINDE